MDDNAFYLEKFNMEGGIVSQPLHYSSGIVFEYTIEKFKVTPDSVWLHGCAGDIDHGHEAEFMLQYMKEKNIIFMSHYHNRRVACSNRIYKAHKHMWEYDDPSRFTARDEAADGKKAMPYYRTMVSKDFVLIPHLVKSIWKGGVNVPYIYIITDKD